MSGAYSQYQEAQREHLRVLSEAHRTTTENYKVRTRHMTKENERRRRALEDKKEAFAKAEVERRKEALELRRKGQQEATLRFRNVIRKPPTKPPEKMISYPTKVTPGAHPNIQAIVTSLHPTPPPPRMVFGHEAEVSSNTLNLNKNGLPTVDDLLRSLRAASEPCTSSDSKSSDSASTSKSSDTASNTIEEKPLGSSHDTKASKEDSSNSSSSVSTAINRKCSLSDTEILKTKLKCEKPLANSRSFRASSPLRPCRSGSCDNFNFRQLRKGAVAKEVLNELQCDSSLLQKTLESNEHYSRDKDFSDSLDISRTDLDDSLEKRVTVSENAEVAWSERAGQKAPLGTDNSVLSLISNCESSAHVIQEVVERPGILKKPRMGAHRSQRGTSHDTLGDNSKTRNETVKRVRFVDQPSTTEVQSYIPKQASYLSQVPTLQKPNKTLPYRTQYNKSLYADSSTFKYDTGAITLPFSTFSTIDGDQSVAEPTELHGKMPTDEEINDLWSEIQSYFRGGATMKPRNGMHSTESSGHFGNRTDSSFVAQKGYSPVTHLSVGNTGSRHRQTNTRTDHILRNEPEGTRRCVSPVQFTFGNSSLRTKETTKSSDSSKLLTKEEQRIRHSLDKLNYRLQGMPNQSGIKYGSSAAAAAAAAVKKKNHASPMTKDSVYGSRPLPHKSSQSSPANISQ